MDSLIARVSKWATWKIAIVFLGLFSLNTILLDALDKPLLELASGEPKLDLRFGYSLQTAHMLFEAYGESGRVLYLWNLLVDTPFPILGSMAVILFIFLGFGRQSFRVGLSIPPALFASTDVMENILIAFMLWQYPDISQTFVAFVSAITQVKRTAFYFTAGILIVGLVAAIVGVVKRKRADGQ
jgi:hypothetical protein